MSGFLSLAVFAVLLTASDFGPDRLPGFTVQDSRREVAGPAMQPRLPASARVTTARGLLPVRERIENLIVRVALRHEIDPDFVACVVEAESGFNPKAVSSEGALGLMQLTPPTAASLGVADALDPASNLEGGTKYLRQLLDQFDSDAVKALAAYNAGPQRVKQYGGVPPYPGTRAFVARIMADYRQKNPQGSPRMRPGVAQAVTGELAGLR